MCLRITLKAFDDFKNKKNSAWSNVFWYVKVCILWKCIQYNIHSDIKHKCQKFPSGKVNGVKSALFYYLQTWSHHSFTFNLWLFDELKNKVCLIKTVVGIFNFWSGCAFIKVYIFCSTKCMDSLTLELHNSFQN